MRIVTQKDTPVTKKYLCCLLLITGIIGFFYLRSGFLYFDLVMIISLICATQESMKDSTDTMTNAMELIKENIKKDTE